MITLNELKQTEVEDKKITPVGDVVVDVLRVKLENGDGWTRLDVFIADGEFQGKPKEKKIGIFGIEEDDLDKYKLMAGERCVAVDVTAKGYMAHNKLQKSYSAESLQLYDGEEVSEAPKKQPITNANEARQAVGNGNMTAFDLVELARYYCEQTAGWWSDPRADQDMARGLMNQHLMQGLAMVKIQEPNEKSVAEKHEIPQDDIPF